MSGDTLPDHSSLHDPLTCELCHAEGVSAELAGLRAENERLRKIEARAKVIWHWVGPGYPDLDDPAERSNFMDDVLALASAYFYGLRPETDETEAR